MESIFDLETLKADLEAVAWEQDDCDPNEESRRVYVGTVFALYPSGKFYSPWACSNVTEAEADRDEAWRQQAETELESIGATLASGEGDPCDLFAVQYRDRPDR